MAKFQARTLLSSLMRNRFSTSAPPPPSAAQSSRSASESAMSIYEIDRAFKKRAKKSTSFLNLFRPYGFEDPQIQKLMECGVFTRNAQNLKPKLDYLVENGFTGELLHKLIVSAPYILLRSSDACIKPNLQVLKQYLGSNVKLMTVINRSKWLLTKDLKLCFIPNIEFLINEGVPANRVSHLLLLQPRALEQSRDRIAYAVKTVREAGIAPDDPMFIHCLRVVSQLSESMLKKKMQLFKSFGWSDEQVLNVLRGSPVLFGLSEETVRSRMDFYVNNLRLEPGVVSGYPLLLAYSVERVHARYEVLKILKSKGFISRIPLIGSVQSAEDRFLRIYVFKHVESVPGLLDMYYGILNRKKTQKGKKIEP